MNDDFERFVDLVFKYFIYNYIYDTCMCYELSYMEVLERICLIGIKLLKLNF